MDMKKSKRFLLVLGAAYWIMAVMIYICAFDQFRFTQVKDTALSPVAVVGEITEDVTIVQNLTASANYLTDIELLTATYGRQNNGTLDILLEDSHGTVLFQGQLDTANALDGQYVQFAFPEPVSVTAGDSLRLTIRSQGSSIGNAVTVYYGNSIALGRVDVPQALGQEEMYSLNGTQGTGKLCVRVNGYNPLRFYQFYWFLVLGLFALIGGYCVWGYQGAKKGRNSGVVAVCTLYCKYQFLLEQLVARDFKTKYRRSYLGIFWSFLNPLLTMTVQYVIFSTLFKSDIPNYPVYLLTGIVLFNFFNEAVALGMTAITNNAPLIKKVYIPKYIYPISRLISSVINFATALVPLLMVMLLTKTPLRLAQLLLLFDFSCMILFVLGMVLLMSTAVVFFQDIQFLWTVLSMIWMYLTPIIYPETIIPAVILPIYRLNPLYHYVTFARTCIIDGVSPAPMAYFWCLFFAVVFFALGAGVFKKNQDKFVLNL